MGKRELTEAEKQDMQMKWEIAAELGLADKVTAVGWGGLTSGESGRIGGIMGQRKKQAKQGAAQVEKKGE